MASVSRDLSGRSNVDVPWASAARSRARCVSGFDGGAANSPEIGAATTILADCAECCTGGHPQHAGGNELVTPAPFRKSAWAGGIVQASEVR